MKKILLIFIFALIISSCNIQKEVSKEEITGKIVIEPKEEVKVVKNDTKSVENNTKVEDNEILVLEEYQARKNIFSTENKIAEIQELLIDLEDKNRINKDKMIDAQKRLDKIKDSFNISYNYYNNKEYLKAKETAIQVKKDAKEIIRTLD
ncbi:hypothetical protein J4471_00840 [Candidatus Woesearchaeota archaeon]|nr:hypothetical protein [Candidatus Woesearchaeota archaeon]